MLGIELTSKYCDFVKCNRFYCVLIPEYCRIFLMQFTDVDALLHKADFQHYFHFINSNVMPVLIFNKVTHHDSIAFNSSMRNSVH